MSFSDWQCRGSGAPSIPPVLSLALSNVTYLRFSVLLSLLFSPACAFLPASSWIICCPCCHLHYLWCWSFKEGGQPWSSCSPGKCCSMGFHSGWRSGSMHVLRSNAPCSEDQYPQGSRVRDYLCHFEGTRDAEGNRIPSRLSKDGLCWSITLEKGFRLIKGTSVLCWESVWRVWLTLRHCPTFAGSEVLQLLCSCGMWCAWRSRMRIP